MFSVVLATACALPVFPTAVNAVPGAAQTPNIVIIIADDMGYGDMSCNGNPTISTPSLDRLAREGMRLTQWYSGHPICTPSRASLLTGRLPIRSGCIGEDWKGGAFKNDAVGGLPENETTFAELLRGQGYATLMVGKWHLGQQPKFLPVAQGFDEYFGIPYSVDMAASAWMNAPFGANVPLPLLHNNTVVEQPVDLNSLDARYTQLASTFIRRNAAVKKPFLLYFAHNHVHVPDYASKDFCKTSLRGRFGDAMAEMDASVGAVMDVLSEAGVEESTLVLFTSDNGPWLIQRSAGGAAGPFFEGKTTTWEGGIRMPAIARWPGKIPAGVTSTAVTTTYDIFATVAALAGAPLPDDRVIDGKDLTGLLLRGEPSPHRCIFIYQGWPSRGLPIQADDPEPGLWAVRCGAYKAHFVTHCVHMQKFGDTRCPNGGDPFVRDPPLLFNVEHDSGEMYPLSSKSKEYISAMAEIYRAKRTHEEGIAVVPNQFAGTNSDSKLATCCNPASQRDYPDHPPCTCNPENFNAFVCAPVDDSPQKFQELYVL